MPWDGRGVPLPRVVTATWRWHRPYEQLEEYFIPEDREVLEFKLTTSKRGACDGAHCSTHEALGTFRCPPPPFPPLSRGCPHATLNSWRVLPASTRPGCCGGRGTARRLGPFSRLRCGEGGPLRSFEAEGFTTECGCLRANTECGAECGCQGTGRCLNRSVSDRRPLRLGSDVVEISAWGYDCYTRTNLADGAAAGALLSSTTGKLGAGQRGGEGFLLSSRSIAAS